MSGAKDLSVVGERVSLTSVDHPSFAIGELLSNIVLQNISHPELRLVTRTLLTPSIIERSSARELVAL